MNEENKDLTVTEYVEEEIKNRVSGFDGDEKVPAKDLALLYEKAKEAELNEKKVEIEVEQKDRENDLKEEEIRQTKIGNWLKFAGTAVTTVIFAVLTLSTQKRDQDFQKEGFGYDNETSKRSSNVMSNLTKLIK